MAVTILIDAIFKPEKLSFSNEKYVNYIYLLGLTISFIIIIFVMSRFLAKQTSRRRKIIYTLLILLLLVIQVLISTNVVGANGIDDFDVRMQASNLSFGNHHWSTYFTEWAPQNVGTTLFFAFLFKISYPLVGIENSSIFINICVMLLIDIALLFGWKTIKLFDKRNTIVHPQDIFFLLALFYSPVYITSLFTYTDPLSLFAITLSLFNYSKYNCLVKADRSKSIYLVLSGVFGALASYLKMNASILLIALLIHFIISVKLPTKKKLAGLLILLASFIFTTSLVGILNSSQNFQKKSNKNFPATYWIAMGLNTNTSGTSFRFNHDLYSYPASLPSKKARNTYEKKIIKKELTSTSSHNLIKLFLNKICLQWARGTIGIGDRSFNITRKTNNYYKYIMGSSRGLFNNVIQMAYIAIWLGFLVSALTGFLQKNPIEIQILCIWILGIFLFHAFMWEAMSRYAYLTAIALMAQSSFGLSYLFNTIGSHSFKINFMYWPLLALLLLTVGAITSKHSVVEESYPHETTIVGQSSIRTTPVKVLPHHKVSEEIKVYYPFNRVYLTNHHLINSDTFSTYLLNKNNKKMPINLLDVTTINGRPGKYQIVFDNKTDQSQILSMLKLPKMDVLQNSSNIPDRYISFKFTNVEKSPTLSVKIYWIFYCIMTCAMALLCLLYIVL